MASSNQKRKRSTGIHSNETPESQQPKSTRAKATKRQKTGHVEKSPSSASKETQKKQSLDDDILHKASRSDENDIDSQTDADTINNPPPPSLIVPETRKPSLKTRRRNRIKAAMEQLKQLHLLSHDSRPDLNYDTRGGKYAKELQEYIKSLDHVASFPNPGYEESRSYFASLVANGNNLEEKFTIRKEYEERSLRMAPKKTLNIISTTDDFKNILATNFRQPIYIPASSQLAKEMSACENVAENYTVKKIWNMINDDQVVACHEQHVGNGPRIPNLRKAKARASFENGLVNILELDVVHDDHNALKPLQLRLSDRIESLTLVQGSSAYRHGSIESKNLKRFFLLSTANTASRAHVDAGGLITWVRCLDGSKWWYWLESIIDLPPEDKSCLARQDTALQDHTKVISPWSRVQLLPGDIFIMPPGMVHAVFTSEDSLFIGGFCLTDATLHRSLGVMSELCTAHGLSNDDLPPQMFTYIEAYYQLCLGSVEGYKLQHIIWFRDALIDFCQTYRSTFSLATGRPKSKKPTKSNSGINYESSSIDNKLVQACRKFVNMIEEEGWVKSLREKIVRLSSKDEEDEEDDEEEEDEENEEEDEGNEDDEGDQDDEEE